ncbi:MAG: hypothetical protein ACJ79K_14730 [Gemmatimonadaceae bacterium]
MTKTEHETAKRPGAKYTGPTQPPAQREPAAVIAELMQKRFTPTRSREEQAFIDLQRGCHQ